MRKEFTLNLSDSSIVYVLAPSGVVTGGAELLHQLVSALQDDGVDARIVYFGGQNASCPEDYKKYNLKYDDNIIDTQNNVLVFYEGIFEKHLAYKNIQKVFWWLSVDNFFLCESFVLSSFDLWKYNRSLAVHTLKQRLRHPSYLRNFLKNGISIFSLRKVRAQNAYQSEYAGVFLKGKGFRNIHPLKDYINNDHFLGYEPCIKEDIVLYNPKKGLEYTQKIMKAAPDIRWIPIINLARFEVVSLMKRAKVYIDFGYHPGKDRLPRECAMNGCCIITGKRGSAAYKGDVNIPDRFKFEESDNVSGIIESIRYCLKEYDEAIDLFGEYRNTIRGEKEEFINQVKTLFRHK